MFSKLFGKKEPEAIVTPSIMGLRIGCSFEIDSLMLRLVEDDLVIENCARTQIIQAVGVVELEDTTLFRFYTDDEAFLQVAAQGGKGDEHVVDVKLFHFYDTQDVSSDKEWNQLLDKDIGQAQYSLAGHNYQRVWTAIGDYHNPVHMAERTYDENGLDSSTDQFTMLFERPIADGRTESLFLAAEEKEEPVGNLMRSFVVSTGISLTHADITIHG